MRIRAQDCVLLIIRYKLPANRQFLTATFVVMVVPGIGISTDWYNTVAESDKSSFIVQSMDVGSALHEDAEPRGSNPLLPVPSP